MSQVSTIIPYYNGGETVVRAIDSVIDNPACLEVLLVVDASPQPLAPFLTDRHRAAITQGKLRVIESNTNLGQAAARNMGVAISHAPFVSFMDQDDMYLPMFCEELSAALHASPDFAAVECGAHIVKNGANALDMADPRYQAVMNSVPWNVLVRRHAFWQAGAFPVDSGFRAKPAGEDMVFKHALKHFFTVGSDLSRQLVRHHLRDGSATDNYLNRTEVVDGGIVFKGEFEDEKNGQWSAAMNRHWEGLVRDFAMHSALRSETRAG